MHVRTEYNVSDFFTKGLTIQKYSNFRDLLMGEQISKTKPLIPPPRNATRDVNTHTPRAPPGLVVRRVRWRVDLKVTREQSSTRMCVWLLCENSLLTNRVKNIAKARKARGFSGCGSFLSNQKIKGLEEGCNLKLCEQGRAGTNRKRALGFFKLKTEDGGRN